MLQRNVDESGISGTGVVAWGVKFPDDVCVLRWASEHRSTAVYPNIADVLAVHGHSGSTEIIWQGDETACAERVTHVAGIPVIRVPASVYDGPDC